MIDWTADAIPEDDVIETAVFGKEVENFVNSKLGKHLLTYARNQVREASDQLKQVSPWRRRRIQQLQNTIACWEAFGGILSEAILDGEQAIKLLEESD